MELVPAAKVQIHRGRTVYIKARVVKEPQEDGLIVVASDDFSGLDYAPGVHEHIEFEIDGVYVVPTRREKRGIDDEADR